jgi:hypothetical protein
MRTAGLSRLIGGRVAKKKFRVTYQIVEAKGEQSYLVDAETAEEAIAICEKGDGEFEDEEVEVKHIDHPVAEEV